MKLLFLSLFPFHYDGLVLIIFHFYKIAYIPTITITNGSNTIVDDSTRYSDLHNINEFHIKEIEKILNKD